MRQSRGVRNGKQSRTYGELKATPDRRRKGAQEVHQVLAADRVGGGRRRARQPDIRGNSDVGGRPLAAPVAHQSAVAVQVPAILYAVQPGLQVVPGGLGLGDGAVGEAVADDRGDEVGAVVGRRRGAGVGSAAAEAASAGSGMRSPGRSVRWPCAPSPRCACSPPPHSAVRVRRAPQGVGYGTRILMGKTIRVWPSRSPWNFWMRPSIQHLWTRPPRVWAKLGSVGSTKTARTAARIALVVWAGTAESSLPA